MWCLEVFGSCLLSFDDDIISRVPSSDLNWQGSLDRGDVFSGQGVGGNLCSVLSGAGT